MFLWPVIDDIAYSRETCLKNLMGGFMTKIGPHRRFALRGVATSWYYVEAVFHDHSYFLTRFSIAISQIFRLVFWFLGVFST